MASDLRDRSGIFLNPLFLYCFILALRTHSYIVPASEVRKLSTMKIDFNRNCISVTVGSSSSFS